MNPERTFYFIVAEDSGIPQRRIYTTECCRNPLLVDVWANISEEIENVFM